MASEWEWVQTALGAYLGAVLAIPCGLWLNRIWKGIQDKEKTSQLKEAVRHSIQRNVELLASIQDHLNRNMLPSFNLDLTILEATADIKYEVFPIPLCQDIDRLLYEYSHLSRKIDLYIKVFFEPIGRAIGGTQDNQTFFSEQQANLVQSLQVHAPEVLNLSKLVLAKIEAKPSADV